MDFVPSPLSSSASETEIMANSPAVDLIPVVVSSWLNVALYTLELVLAARYFAGPARPFTHKIAVVGLLCADTVCTIVTGFSVCLGVVPMITTNFRLFLAPLMVSIITTYMSSAVTQLFLCNILYRLTKNKVVTGAVLMLVFVHLGFSWASAILTVKTKNVVGMVVTTTVIGAIICAVTDISIAVCLSWKFWGMMGELDSGRETRSLIRRILVLTVSSGAFCATNTLLVMIFLLCRSSAFDFFFTCLGRVYALTLLGNFLVGIPGWKRDEPTLNFPTNVDTSIAMFRSLNTAAPPQLDPVNTETKAAWGPLRSTSSAPAVAYPQNHLPDSVYVDFGSVREKDVDQWKRPRSFIL
ncbi:hypothetical protein B0H19DRAFT_1271931 [Mycena capillaripes]|nr:hypothetical protein B0H19DRAFT_1271931 [Mycena capillaripes]